MPAGVPTSEDVRAKFRAEYLVSGNASDSARKVGIPESTGRDIAAELNTDVAFGEDRRALRASYLDECVNARMAVMRKARDRALADEADVYPHEGGLTVIDKRKEWADVVLAAEKNAHALAKVDGEKDGTALQARDVTITITGLGEQTE